MISWTETWIFVVFTRHLCVKDANEADLTLAARTVCIVPPMGGLYEAVTLSQGW